MLQVKDNFAQVEALLKQLQKKIVEELTLESLKYVMRATYEEIYPNWPHDTYWSAANHQIAFGNPGVQLIPPTRPRQKDALLAEAQVNKQANLSKITTLSSLQKTYISNPVPYSSDVGYKPGFGNQIYEVAANVGAATLEAGIAGGAVVSGLT